jgi:hypothetical protein
MSDARGYALHWVYVMRDRTHTSIAPIGLLQPYNLLEDLVSSWPARYSERLTYTRRSISIQVSGGGDLAGANMPRGVDGRIAR